MYGRLYSRNSISSKINYSIDLGSPIESAPLISDGKMYVHLRDHKIVALDAQTGKVFWTYQRSIPFKITLQRVSRPVSYGESIIVGFGSIKESCLQAESTIKHTKTIKLYSIKFFHFK